jgi:hypothetical protein
LNKAYLSLFVFLFDLSAVVFAWGGGFLLRFNFDVPANFVSVMSWGLVFSVANACGGLSFGWFVSRNLDVCQFA